MALVSFLVPAYKARFLQEALDSMLSQTFTDHEIIVVDDASPQELETVVCGYRDPRIRYYRNAENIGGKSLVAQWTNCLQYVTGKFMVLAADDDIYDPYFLETCLSLFDKYPNVNMARTGSKQIDEKGRLIGIDGILPEHCSKYQYLFYWLQAAAFTCMGNMMFRTDVLKRKGFVDLPCAFGSDTATAVQMSEQGVGSSPLMLFSFRISNIHLSSDLGKLDEKLEANTLLFEWIGSLGYHKPEGILDRFMFERTSWPVLYAKCRYDYYNLVIKHLPFFKFYWIQKCRLLTTKDKVLMFLRFCKDKVIGQ
ncbi:glycosyltransferase family 2 protein [Sphingobacterium suaedae]|uniref:Glycosyltransferase family 2 protein n=1 Tax=Sphingobacterium suaedae TaxID=1686402 RepID=A0ABW5KKL7_9SPHI